MAHYLGLISLAGYSHKSREKLEKRHTKNKVDVLPWLCQIMDDLFNYLSFFHKISMTFPPLPLTFTLSNVLT